MTTYPRPNDPTTGFTRAGGTSELHSVDHGRVIGIWENVKHHGATGNGTTDDTAAFTAAIAALGVQGGTVYVPPGNYKITSTIFTASYVQILGAGPVSRLLHFAGSNPLIDIPAYSTQTTIKNIGLAGVNAAYGTAGTGTGHGIYVHGVTAGSQYVTRTYIEHNFFDGIGDATHWVIYAIWGIETHIHKNDIVHAGGGGVYLGDACNASTVRDNTASNNADGALGGLFLDGPNGIISTGNVWESWRGSYAIKIAGGGQHIIDREWLEDCSGTDLILDGTTANGRITNTVIRAMGGDDLTINRCIGITLDNVTFQNMTLTSGAAANQDTSVAFHNSYATISFNTAGLVNAKDRIIYNNPKAANGISPSGLKFTSGGVTDAVNADFGIGYISQTERTAPSTPAANELRSWPADDDGVTRPHFITADGVDWRVRGERSPVTLTDAATVTVNAAAGHFFPVTLTAARTFGAPSNPTDGQEIAFFIYQNTGGPITPSWNAAYLVTGGTFTIADNSRRCIKFTYWKASGLWVESGRT